MKKTVYLIVILIAVLGLRSACPAQERTYRIEVLQITDFIAFQQAYDGFIRELARSGLVQGKNLTVKRTIIDYDVVNPTIWKKAKALWRIRSEASRIASEKPDLVLTVGTPVTRYAKDKIIAAGIPVVFTAAAFPVEAGARSLTEAGPGFTGATSHMDMGEAIRIVKIAFPNLKKVGVVYSANLGSHIDEAIEQGKAHGFTFITEEAGMKEHITPFLQDLRKKGAEAFVVPPDPYYLMRNYEEVDELAGFSRAGGVPVISFVIVRFPGAVLYVGVDLEHIGALSGRQAMKILTGAAKPESLPILRQDKPTVLVDQKLAKSLGIQLSPEILQIAQPVE
ncbi:MAG TPA: ABC transporter substrate binding protein [Deltaproteobacteria bacterium]|nr:ABC transporter substrate binding protein [Deltaproteobacteria bacterium]